MGFKWINKDVPKIGVRDLARGSKPFSDDISLNDALVLKVFRSHKAHAKILSLEVAEALKIPGVVGILTSKDIHGRNLFGLIKKDQPLLAQDKVRFAGDPLALVAAKDAEAAQDAMAAIHVAYEDLPAVFDPEEGLEDDAPLIHEGGNLLLRRTLRKADVDKGLAQSHVVVKRIYNTPLLEQS